MGGNFCTVSFGKIRLGFFVSRGMRCVHCACDLPGGVFVRFSAENYRLANCPSCKRTADEYVECELMIHLIDMVLHKPEVYRHLFFNDESITNGSFLWKAFAVYLCLDSLVSADPASIVYTSTKRLVTAAALLAQYLATNWLIFRYILRKQGSRNLWKQILLATAVSSFFKLSALPMLVWDFSRFMVFVLDILVFSSNAVAFSVILETSATASAISVAASALPVLLLKNFYTRSVIAFF